MRKSLGFAGLFAALLAASVVAQRSDRPDAPGSRAQPRPADDGRAPPPGMDPGMQGTKLEWLMLRPARVKLRDTWSVGRFECKPWDAGPAAENPEKSYVRVTAVAVRDAQDANDKAAGIELVL